MRNCDLRHLAVGQDTSVDRKLIMIKSVHRSRCRRLMSIKVPVVTAPKLQRTLSTDIKQAYPSHIPPLSDTCPCTGTFDVCHIIEVYSARHHRGRDVLVRIQSLPGCPGCGCRGMRRYAVVGGPPLSKYCTSCEAVFVCSGHLRAVRATIFGCA